MADWSGPKLAGRKKRNGLQREDKRDTFRREKKNEQKALQMLNGAFVDRSIDRSRERVRNTHAGEGAGIFKKRELTASTYINLSSKSKRNVGDLESLMNV